VDRGELSRRAGLFQRGRPGQGAGFADQRLEVVVQIEAGLALARQPFVAGHLGTAVEYQQV
jgi:hypothetical protein